MLRLAIIFSTKPKPSGHFWPTSFVQKSLKGFGNKGDTKKSQYYTVEIDDADVCVGRGTRPDRWNCDVGHASSNSLYPDPD